ncbi:hypothetical protein RN001_002008 [Aquatica leii]|uniref:Myb/SANT-like DNA-binding domain-containing protein n=1 Tax=Aquatica leii TaxID=1421715 RepID=A0AAN7SJW2_9COLE|nr:hypothetical protein RN001_002008 [Aquatica leii]
MEANNWLIPIRNENNEVVFDENGCIYIYNKGNQTTGYVDDTEENRVLLGMPLAAEPMPVEVEPEAETENSQHQEIKWTHESILLLLTLYEDHNEQFKSSKKRNKTIWNLIGQSMSQKGYPFTGDNCDIKFRNLKKTYKRIKDNNNGSGRGAISWPYFKQFDELFGSSHAVLPIATASNISGYITSPTTSETDIDLAGSSRSSTPTGPPQKKRCVKNTDTEPAWLKEFRKEQSERHAEKISILKELIGVLKENK